MAPPNSLVVNLGIKLAQVSEGKIVATRHRVVDIHRERFSAPYFMNPHFKELIRISKEVQEGRLPEV